MKLLLRTIAPWCMALTLAWVERQLKDNTVIWIRSKGWDKTNPTQKWITILFGALFWLMKYIITLSRSLPLGEGSSWNRSPFLYHCQPCGDILRGKNSWVCRNGRNTFCVRSAPGSLVKPAPPLMITSLRTS